MALERILLVRHALSGGNNEGIIQGQRNFPIRPGYKPNVDKLTDLIFREEQLGQLEPDTKVYVVCSNLDRAFYTASRIHNGLTEKRIQSGLEIIPELTERGVGILEGKKYAEAIPILARLLPADTALDPTAKGIYPHLYALNNIPGGENHEEAERRAEEALKRVQGLQGVVIIVSHGIFGLNYLKNFMTDDHILGRDASQSYQHFPNLSVVRLEREKYRKEDRFPQRLFATWREPLYIATGPYGPPQNGSDGNDRTANAANRLAPTP